MLILFETASGLALFRVSKSIKKLDADELAKELGSDAGKKKIPKFFKLKNFEKFTGAADALETATAIVEGKVSERLKSLLSNLDGDTVGVVDQKLVQSLQADMDISAVTGQNVREMARAIRENLSDLITGLPTEELATMSLSLSHSLSRYNLKFSPDKVDTMIVQAIGLLDDLDKELNTYAMRVKEWYGWHFPEMAKIIVDNVTYAKVVKHMGLRDNIGTTDLGAILDEEVEALLKKKAFVSMGTEIGEEDINHISELAEQVISIAEYKGTLQEYLKSRMMTIAPNLTTLVGHLVGARLIAHAGSLRNLSKYPASTIQILGAEKALFRALKTKHDTPKYGLIYHASLVGQTPSQYRGKISRVLAAKAALSIRVDALGNVEGPTVAIEHREKVEMRIRMLEGYRSNAKKAERKDLSYDYNSSSKTPRKRQSQGYNTGADSTMEEPMAPASDKGKKRKQEGSESEAKKTKTETPKTPKSDKKKKKKKEKKTPKSEKKEKKTPKSDKKKKKKKKD